jgi:hypothetical protein
VIFVIAFEGSRAKKPAVQMLKAADLPVEQGNLFDQGSREGRQRRWN